MRSAMFAFAVLMSLAPVGARAEVRYWIDEAIRVCTGVRQGNTALAASSAGRYDCIYGGQTAEASKAAALGQCNKNLSAAERRVAPCQPVWLNGKITGGAFHRAMARDFRVAVLIKSWDGSSKKEIDYRGFMIAGKSLYQGGTTRNAVRLVLDDGREICRGWITPIGKGRTQGFEMQCLADLTLRGKATLTGMMKVDGYYRYAAFTATITNPPHRMTVWTP